MKKNKIIIKEKLPYRYRNILAEKTGYSSEYISRVINGNYENDKITTAALELIRDIQESKNAIQKQINELAKSKNVNHI